MRPKSQEKAKSSDKHFCGWSVFPGLNRPTVHHTASELFHIAQKEPFRCRAVPFTRFLWILIILWPQDHPNDPESARDTDHKNIKRHWIFALHLAVDSCGGRGRGRGRSGCWCAIVNNYWLFLCLSVFPVILRRAAAMHTDHSCVIDFFSAFWAKHRYLRIKKKCANWVSAPKNANSSCRQTIPS